MEACLRLPWISYPLSLIPYLLSLCPLQRPAIRQRGSLGNDEDAVADHAVGRFFAVFEAFAVDRTDIGADAAVLVDDRAFDVRAGAYAQRGDACGRVGGDFVRLL